MRFAELYFKLQNISIYRTSLMGMAALFVLLVHSTVFIKNMPPFLSCILAQGDFGVDLFFFSVWYRIILFAT